MPGVPGRGGPPPKRSDQRRRTNKPDVPIVKAPAGEVIIPETDEGWHRIGRMWFDSLRISGQSAFYTSSDWSTAYAIAESMSREFNRDGPVAPAAMAMWFRGMGPLMVMEGDRRRARLELERGSEEADGDVAWIDNARARLREPG